GARCPRRLDRAAIAGGDRRTRYDCGAVAGPCRARCARPERTHPRRLPIADVRATLGPRNRRTAPWTRLRVASRLAGRPLGYAAECGRLLWLGSAHRAAANTKRAGTSARSRARPRPALRRPE